MLIETTVSPFHCLYQDALELHKLSRLRHAYSEAESSRLARAALLLYVMAAEALVHQAAVELAPPELAALVTDPAHPLPLTTACRLLPALVGSAPHAPTEPEAPPWPQFAELLAVRDSWAYPGPASQRKAYYHAPRDQGEFEPLSAREAASTLGLSPDDVQFPRTGLPKDPYALRPNHLDTIRAILDAIIVALDRRLDGELTRDARHRKEPVRVLSPV